MPNAIFPNLTPYTYNHSFSQIWAHTRAMIKAGWTYVKSSNGATIDATTPPNPDNDKWGGPTSTGNTGAAASFSSKTLDDITVTGVTGMTTASVGRFLTITGAGTGANNGTWQIVAYVSATSVRIRSASGSAPDGNNGAITWTEKDHALSVYSTVQATLDAGAAWILLQGPSTLKIPIAAGPSPAFMRGEKVTQAVSGAEGEVMGTVANGASTSFLIVQPRIGTFDSSNVITGAFSGATVSPNATVITMVCEVVFAKTTDVYSGWVFYQRVDAASESAQRFSALTPTAAVAPGNSTAANAFPTIAYSIKGAANGASINWFYSVTGVTSAMMLGRGQAMVANAIGNTGVSPDGTFWMVQAFPGTSSETFGGFGFSRMDDMEDGEVDPYVWMVCSTSPTRISGGTNYDNLWTSTFGFWVTNSITHLTWRKRSYGGTGDTWVKFAYPSYLQQILRGNPFAYNPGDPERVASTTLTLNPREAVWVIDCDSGERFRKGTHRWLFSTGQGNFLNVWDSKTWLQVLPITPASRPGIVIGPWDGTTDPIYV